MALIPDHPYRILIIGGSRPGKTNVLLKLIKHQLPENGKNFLYIEDLVKSMYTKNRNYSQPIDDVYKTL